MARFSSGVGGAAGATEPINGPAGERLSLAVVFLLSRRCNLQCDYCNVLAGPQVRTRLDPRAFESWVQAFATLGEVDLGIQLHGGEPLMLDPSLELYSSIARSALAPRPGARMGLMGVVTNGLLLDRVRAQSLIDAGFHIVVSVDGTERIHDRYRRNAAGHGSHRQAMKAVQVLRALGREPAIIAVVTEPDDVQEALEFFMAEGLSRVKINPVRPEGRGVAFPPQDAHAHMTAMADAHFRAAKTIATHNRRHPDRPVYEENTHVLMSRIVGIGSTDAARAAWTLMVDDVGRLWSHPGGHGVEHMALTDGEPPTAELVSRALGLREPTGRAAQLEARQRDTFRPCRDCPDPMRCTQFRPLVDEDHGAGLSPDCLWRERLTELLRAWWRESPEEASLVACGQDFGEATRTVPPLRPDASGRAHEVAVEADWGAGAPEPITRALLDSVHITPDGGAYLGDHANWVLRLKGLDAREHPRLFVQLAVLASNLAEREDRLPLARAVAHLARIGLVPLARETRRV